MSRFRVPYRLGYGRRENAWFIPFNRGVSQKLGPDSRAGSKDEVRWHVDKPVRDVKDFLRSFDANFGGDTQEHGVDSFPMIVCAIPPRVDKNKSRIMDKVVIDVSYRAYPPLVTWQNGT